MIGVKSEVNQYTRKIKRELKDGTKKSYETHQFTIQLKASDKFQGGDPVIIFHLEEYQAEKEHLEKLQDELTQEMEKMETKISKKTQDHEILENKFKHLQARLDKEHRTNDELRDQILKLQNRGITDYIRNIIKKPKKALPGVGENKEE